MWFKRTPGSAVSSAMSCKLAGRNSQQFQTRLFFADWTATAAFRSQHVVFVCQHSNVFHRWTLHSIMAAALYASIVTSEFAHSVHRVCVLRQCFDCMKHHSQVQKRVQMLIYQRANCRFSTASGRKRIMSAPQRTSLKRRAGSVSIY